MSAVKVSNLLTKFGSRVVHDYVSFDIKKGEIFTIIGSSGAGKSTLLKEMILLLKPNGGSIEILGKNILEFDDKEAKRFSKNWGVLFQSSALFSSLTVAENISIVLKEHANISGAFANELIKYKLSLVGLPQFAASLYPSELSGGMKKRAALARALALEPSILFLDEPTSGLDPISSRAFDKLVLSLKEALNLTCVIVSHDVNSVCDISERVMAMHEARIAFLGRVEEAKKSSHPFLKSFFDA